MKILSTTIKIKNKVEYLTKKQRNRADYWKIVPEKRYLYSVELEAESNGYFKMGHTIFASGDEGAYTLFVTKSEGNKFTVINSIPIPNFGNITDAEIISQAFSESDRQELKESVVGTEPPFEPFTLNIIP